MEEREIEMTNDIKELFSNIEVGSEVVYDERVYHYDLKNIKRGIVTDIIDCEWMDVDCEQNDYNSCRGCIGQIDIDHRGATCTVYGDDGGDKCYILKVIQPVREDFINEKEFAI